MGKNIEEKTYHPKYNQPHNIVLKEIDNEALKERIREKEYGRQKYCAKYQKNKK